MTQAGDATLMKASVAEPAAFGELFDRHVRVVMRYAARRLGDGRADDIAAETFRIAFERRATFDPARGDVRPWLLGIATNVIRNHVRDEERRLRALGGVVVDGGDDVVAEPAIVAAPEVGAALAALEPGDRDALVLVAWEDMTYQQVADALDIPVGTVRSRLHRARQQLRANLSAHLDEEDVHG
jgi:RNA polymerase sigma factor (sigma-70 family)